MQHRHGALGILVEILPQAVLQEGVLHGGGHLRHADALGEIADGRGGIAPAAQAAQGRHAGIVPAGHEALLHQLAQLALGHDRVVDAQAGKLDLPGAAGQGQVVHEPVVQGPVILVLQGAQGVGNALQSVLHGMGKVVHGIDAPLVSLAVVVDVADAVDDRIAHVEVAGGQVDLRPEGHAALGELTVFHPLEQVQGLLDGPVAVGGDGGDAHVAPVGLELLRGELAHVGQALADQLLRQLVVLLKVVRAVVEAVAPVEAQPVDVVLDGLDVFRILLRGVGVVHAKVADAAEALCGAEVDAQGLAVADVQVAVGLRREAGVHLHALVPAAGGQILHDEALNKISGFEFQFLSHVSLPDNVRLRYIITDKRESCNCYPNTCLAMSALHFASLA